MKKTINLKKRKKSQRLDRSASLSVRAIFTNSKVSPLKFVILTNVEKESFLKSIFSSDDKSATAKMGQIELISSALDRYKIESKTKAKAVVKTGQTIIFNIKLQNDTDNQVWEDKCSIKCIKPEECWHFEQ